MNECFESPQKMPPVSRSVAFDHLIAEALPRGSVQFARGVARPNTNSKSSYLERGGEGGRGHSLILHPS